MPADNIWVAVDHPDRLRAGDDPLAAFAVRYIQVYRYSSESNARADSGATLLDAGSGYTWEVIAESNDRTEAAGPWRYGYYDSGQTDDSWYRYRFADASLVTFSPLSYPWQSDRRSEHTLRNLISEVGQVMREGVERGTIEAGSDADDAVVTSIFQSTLKDARWYKGAWLWVRSTTDGGAPENEERLIASVNTGTGTATVDRSFSAALGAGDVVEVFTLLRPSEIVKAINRVRERMKLVQNSRIAVSMVSGAGNRIPAPQGVYRKADVISVEELYTFTDSDWEDRNPIRYDVEFDGIDGWIVFHQLPDTDTVVVRHEISWRDFEGELSDLDDSTEAPLQWLRKAAAWEAYRFIDASDEAPDNFARLAAMTAQEVYQLSAQFSPEVVRPLATGRRKLVGPAEV